MQDPPTETAPVIPPTWRRLLAVILAVAALAFAARVYDTQALRPATGAIRTPSPDAHYYLQRTVDTYRTFPHVAEYDRRLSCPAGTAPPWPHGLNLAGAALAHLLLPAQATDSDVERLVAWLPALLGAAACALLAWLGALWFGWLAGLLAGSLAALMPIRVWNSAFAIVDHHVLGALLPLLIVAGFLSGDRRPGRRTLACLWRVDGYLLAALVVGLGYASWTEMWLQHGLLLAAGLGWACFDPRVGTRRVDRLSDLLRWTSWSAVAALPGIMSAPYSQRGLVAPHAPSRFTLWLLLAFVFAAAAALWAHRRWLERRALPLGAAVLGGGLALGLAALVDPAMANALGAAAGFAGGGGIVGAIDESQALFSRPMPQPLMLLSGAILLAPALPLAWWRGDPSRATLLTVWYGLSLPLALLQTRFALPFSTPLCLALGATIALGLPASFGAGRSRWLRALATLLALTVLPAVAVRGLWSAELESRDRLMGWMATELAPSAQGTPHKRCLLAPWDIGHEAVRVGHMAVVAHPFTEHSDRTRIRALAGFLLGDAAAAEAWVRSTAAGVVWVAAMDADDLKAHYGELGRAPAATAELLRTTWARLMLADGSAVRLAGGSAAQVLPGFGWLRRVRTSPLLVQGAVPGGPPRPVHHDKVFVVVAGARIVGACRPGAEVEASLQIQHPGAPPFRFAQVATCSPAGRFSLRVPYANAGMGHQLRAGPRWRLAERAQATGLARVTEADVQLGRAVTVDVAESP